MMMTNFSADEYFGSDLMMQMQAGMEYGGLFGTGTEFQPLGLYNNKNIQQIKTSSLDANYADTNGVPQPDLFAYLRSVLLRTNINREHIGWLMEDMTLGLIYNMKSTDGSYLYRWELDQGKLIGFPVVTTNALEIDKNGKTMLFFGAWDSLVIGDMAGIETFTTLEGSWKDSAGVAHNAFSENLSGTRATMYVDFAMRYDEAMICVDGLKVQ